jgi:adenine phosphoribosyltransferase
MASEWMDAFIRRIPDLPTQGETFRDITPLLANAAAFGRAVDDLVSRFHDLGIDRVVGIESRGFIIAAPIAYRLRAGFAPVRKAGKLPWAVAREEYRTEGGSAKLEIHRDAIGPGERVLVIDDVLATGGTARATCQLIETLGGEVVALGFMLEVTELKGRDRLPSRRIESLTEV